MARALAKGEDGLVPIGAERRARLDAPGQADAARGEDFSLLRSFLFRGGIAESGKSFFWNAMATVAAANDTRDNNFLVLAILLAVTTRCACDYFASFFSNRFE